MFTYFFVLWGEKGGVHCDITCVKVRGQLVQVGYLLPPMEVRVEGGVPFCNAFLISRVRPRLG